ncbi:MAG: hypothetical protein LQ341_007256 [Variospora aurantia]|nr:MAG: hypothetical protein LQ341_007256 [Variospora aurantia]
MSEEETLQILYQGLQALEYLHSQTPPVAHRDMKPENILVQSRTPFVIKLVDFGLAKNDASLKTFCGTNQYAAPEIWEHRRYTPLVDIWSLGVIVVHYGYGLPKPSHKRKGMPWCQDLSQFAEDREGEGDALMDLISTKMLRMRYEQRQSARHCLGEVRRLGFHVIQPFDEGRTTPPRKTSTQGRATMTKSILMQTRQTAPLDRNKYLGCYATSGASLRTEVATSKRELREGVHFSDLASPQSLNRNPQRPTQIGNPRSEDKGTLSKRRRPQTTQSPTADPVGEGQSKRARASVSCEASEQLSKASNPRPGPERSIDSDPGGPFTINVASFVQETASLPQIAPESARDRAISLLGRSSAQAATVNSIETEKPLLKRNVHNDVRAMLDENLDGKDEGTREVTDFDAGHIQMRIDNKTVLMRKEDCFLNATQILTLANKNASDRKYLISLVKEQTKIQVLPATAGVPHPCSWVNFQHGLILCKYLELEHQLQPLINYGLRAQRDGSKTPVPVYDYLTEV